MTLNAYFLEKPTCRRESWLTKNTYPQNIQRTFATLVNKRRHGRRLPNAASVEKWDQTACKPGSVPPAAAKRRALAIIPLDRPSRDGSRDLPGPLGPTTALPSLRRAHGPYSVLLLAGLAMPSLLPGTRWALTPPFHPSPPSPRLGREVCFLWRYPWGRPRRALPAAMSSWSPDFPRPPCGSRDRPAVWSVRKVRVRGAGVKFTLPTQCHPGFALAKTGTHRRRRFVASRRASCLWVPDMGCAHSGMTP
jgi:hypothetical protein